MARALQRAGRVAVDLFLPVPLAADVRDPLLRTRSRHRRNPGRRTRPARRDRDYEPASRRRNLASCDRARGWSGPEPTIAGRISAGIATAARELTCRRFVNLRR